MTITLLDIIKSGLINVGDSVEFTFKKYYFSAKIIRGGLLSECKMRRPNSLTLEPILEHVTSFSSLTAFTEACLQDILEEYYTRYSSWKRVTHLETKQSMGEIRDRCKLTAGTVKSEDILELYKEIHRLQIIIDEMSTLLKEKGNFQKKWNVVMMKKQKTRKRILKKRKIENPEAYEKIQDMMLTDINFGC